MDLLGLVLRSFIEVLLVGALLGARAARPVRGGRAGARRQRGRRSHGSLPTRSSHWLSWLSCWVSP